MIIILIITVRYSFFMHANADDEPDKNEWNLLQTAHVKKFNCKTSFNELIQLWNSFWSDMNGISFIH